MPDWCTHLVAEELVGEGPVEHRLRVVLESVVQDLFGGLVEADGGSVDGSLHVLAHQNESQSVLLENRPLLPLFGLNFSCSSHFELFIFEQYNVN